MPAALRIVHALEKNRLTTGSVVQMLDAARGLVSRGHSVTVVSRSGGDLETACADSGVRFLPLPLRHEFDLLSARLLRRHLRSSPCDLIHVHKGRPHAIALLAAFGLGRRPLLVVNRGVSFPLDFFNKWKYRHPRVAAVVCVAEAVRQVVITSAGLDPQRVHTIHAGCDTDRFDPARVDATDLRRELGLGHRHLVVAQVSIREWKGWRELLAAFATLAPRFPDARLLLVGCEPPDARATVERRAAELAIADRVLLLGYRRDMPQVLAACDIVADASWAGTGITGTIREAMAMGRAVVASDCAGNRELVTSEATGRLVPPRDVAALARALELLMADRRLRDTMGAAARRRVVREFSTAQRVARLEALYSRLANQETSPAGEVG